MTFFDTCIGLHPVAETWRRVWGDRLFFADQDF